MDKRVIHSVFEEGVRSHPSKTAIESENGNVTYGELNRRANILSHLLTAIGCQKGVIINVVAPSSIQLVNAMLSVFKSGGIFLPVDPSFSKKRLMQIFNDTFDGILVVSADIYEGFVVLTRELNIPLRYVIVMGEDDDLLVYHWENGGPVRTAIREQPGWDIDPSLTVNGDDGNYIFYTSGSTGEGKAILGAHASLSHFIHWEIREFSIDETCRVSQLTQATFDASLRDIFVALIAGGTLCIPPAGARSNPSRLLKWLEKSAISLLHCVPSLFRMLLKELQAGDIRYDPASLKYILMAGELLYAKDIINWRKIAGDRVKLVNLYGATETTLIKAFYRIDLVSDNPAQIIPAGMPISNTIIAVVKDGHICEQGEIGEIYVKTPFASKGYYRNEKLTAECFVQNPLQQDVKDIVYKTGDVGRYLADGNIEVLGRLDSQVKVNGIRVELGEVEQAVMKQKDISGVVVKAHRTDDNVVTLIAYYTGRKTDAGELRDQLGKELNQQLIPSYFIHLDEFPLNINGKVDKKALPVPEEVVMGEENFESPAGDMEERLAMLWKEILGLKKVGRNISFFSVGGHSLRAIQLVSKIHKEFGIDLKIADIFAHRTIQDLAGLITSSSKKEYVPIDPVPLQLHYELSSSQRRMWILSQFDERNPAYNVQETYVFEGELYVASLEYAFAALIARHEVLRTFFKEDEQGEVRQFIYAPEVSYFRLTELDLRGEDVSEQDRRIKKLLREDLVQPFDLSAGALFRAGLFRVTDQKWIFSYTLHHIISDGWSIGIIIRELLTFYNTHLLEEDAPMEELRIQYKDYAAWQQQQLRSDALAAHKKYWLQQFEGEMPVLELPGDRTRPAMRSGKGGVITRSIEAALGEKIRSLCEEQGATVFMGLLAAVTVLLHRYTHQEDIIIGSPIAGREHADLEGQIGFYVNTLALRAKFKGTDKYVELLEHIKRVTMDAYEYQAYPFDELVNELHLRRDMGRNPMFDVMVVLQIDQADDVRKGQYLDGLKVYGYQEGKKEFSKFDLQFNFIETAHELSVSIEYNTDIFNADTAGRLGDDLQQLLAAIVEQPLKPIELLELMDQAERRIVIEEFNATSVAYPKGMTVVGLLEAQVEKVPDAIAIAAGDVSFTYKQLNDIANQLAAYLTTHYKIQANDLAGIKLQRSEWMIIAVLGVLKSGGAFLPIDPEYPQERIDHMLENSACKVVLDEDEIRKFRETPVRGQQGNPVTVHRQDDLAYVIYTSGSTGRPKGCAITHGNLFNYVFWANSYYPNGGKKMRAGLYTSLSFDLTITSFFCPLTQGGMLTVYGQHEAFSTMLTNSFGESSGINTIKLTPSHINVLEHLGIKSSTMLCAIVGGEAVTSRQVRVLKEINPAMRIYNEYGPTETTVGCVVKELEIDEPVTIGKPVANMRIYILGEGGAPCPVGFPGEIFIGGAGVAVGYINHPEQTAAKFIMDPFREGQRMYKTGDIGRWLPDGNIEFMGRKDDQVKIRGHRIELGEIEHVLRSSASISAAAVVVRSSGMGEKEIVAYVVSVEPLQAAELRRWLGRYLPEYMLPSHFVQLEELPLTVNGKLDRKRLPDPGGQEMATGVAYVAARNEVERQVVAVYEDVLKRRPIGVGDDFFVLGGDSIKSILIVSRLRQRGYATTIRDVLSYPVVEELADRVRAVSRTPDQGTVEGYITLSPIQQVFFGDGSPDKHHYNQSVLLRSRGTLSEGALRAVLERIVVHHDALRMVYRQVGGGWVQENRGKGQGYSLEVITMYEGMSMGAHCDRIQGSMDLGEGPLLKAGLFRDAKGDRLLLTVHHLVMDGVSWRILLEDLSAMYEQYQSGGLLHLPLKTDSFKYWQDRQEEYAKSEALRAEGSYWSAIESLSIPVLPMDHEGGSNLVKDAAERSFRLDEELTGRLLTRCYKAYHTEINDILLAGLSAAIEEVFGLERILINLEGHGREPMGMDVDVTRTIGWFTTMYPVVLDMRYSGDSIRHLVGVKEVLHRVPNKGIGYGILRYMGGSDYRLQPAITFNYLGEFGSSGGAGEVGGVFGFSGEYHGLEVSGERRRGSVLEVSGMVVEGRMQLSVVYSGQQYDASTIGELQESYRKKLEELIAILSSDEQSHLSPVDLTYKELSVEELQKLNKLLC